MQSKIDVKKKFKKLRFWKLVCKTTKTVSIFILIFMTDKGEGGGDFSSRAMQMICVGFSKLITEHRLCIP